MSISPQFAPRSATGLWTVLLVAVLGILPRMGLAERGPSILGGFAFVQRIFQSEEGLPGNAVRSVAADRLGVLWIATAEGVARYDGKRFVPFTKPGEIELSRRSARRIFPLPNGEVWVALTRGALLRWDGQKLSEVRPEDADPFSMVTQLFEDPKGGVLASLVPGQKVLHWTAENGVKTEPEDPRFPPLFLADKLYWEKRGRMVSPLPFNNSGVPARHELLDAGARLWLTNSERRLLMQEGTKAPVAVPMIGLHDGYQVSELAADAEGTVWVATLANGLIQFLPSRLPRLPEELGYPEAACNSVLARRDGTLIMAPRDGGLLFADHRGVAKDSKLDERLPSPFRGQGLLFEDADANLWVSSRFGSLRQRFFDQWIRVPGPSGRNMQRVRCMTQDAAGKLWFADGNSILTKDACDEWLVLGPEQGIPRQEVTALAADARGLVWAGNSVGDIFVSQTSQPAFTMSTQRQTANGRGVSMLLAEADGWLYAATLGSGLLVRTPEPEAKWHSLGEAAGIPEPRLTSIIADNHGRLWMGSLRGVLMVSKEDLAQHLRGNLEKIPWGHFDHLDGMPSRECSGSTASTVSRAPDGRLFFATASGIAVVDPKNWAPRKEELEILFNSVRVNGEEIAYQMAKPTGTLKELTLGTGPVQLEVDLIAPSLRSGDKVSYAYKMEGVDQDWIHSHGEPTLLYRRLLPGKHTLLVNASQPDGVWRRSPVALSLLVHTPYWQTWWFLTLSGLGVLGFAYFLGWYLSRKRLRKRVAEARLEAAREAERSRIARDLHDDLGASLTEITLLASLGADTSTDAAVAREILQSLETKTRHTVGTLDEIVWAVNPRYDTVKSFAEYLAAFAVDLTEAAGLRLRLDLADDLPDQPLRSEERHHLFLACREAMNNAVKHSGGTEMKISVQTEAISPATKLVPSPKLILRVGIADNGKGFDAREFNLCEGLKNLEQRLTEMEGVCQIASSPGVGTTVTLRLPLATITTIPTNPASALVSGTPESK